VDHTLLYYPDSDRGIKENKKKTCDSIENVAEFRLCFSCLLHSIVIGSGITTVHSLNIFKPTIRSSYMLIL